MKIVVDDKIPYIREVISEITPNAVYLKGADISSDDVRDADALIVRTRTRCDEHLLKGSKVKFIATATIGFDHIDTDYLKKAGIEWMNCPGCNSGSVAQYLRSSLILLCRNRGLAPCPSTTVGVVGYGHVGKKVVDEARQMGFRVIVCDPPLQSQGDTSEDFVSLEDIKAQSDVITFHVPLVKTGDNSTWHIADGEFFSHLPKKPIIVNTSRGGVVDNDALMSALNAGLVRDAVIDTWENEPNINRLLLNKVYIATPHIAGYSADGKTNADNMVIEGLCRYFGIENRWHINPPMLPSDFVLHGSDDDMRLQLYNPQEDCARLKSDPAKFEELRGNYPLRREKIEKKG